MGKYFYGMIQKHDQKLSPYIDKYVHIKVEEIGDDDK